MELGNVAAEILREGGIAAFAPADAADPGATTSAIERLVHELGPVDMLIANAGVGLEVSARNFSAANFARMVQVNLIGPAVAIEAVLPAMIERQSGRIVGISSLAGYRGVPGSAGYSASKSGLTTFLEALRPELKRAGIAVTVVHPGYIRTPMTAEQRHPQPFLMDAEPAVRIILQGVERRRPRVDFPQPMVALLTLARLLPATLYDPLAARLLLGRDTNRKRHRSP